MISQFAIDAINDLQKEGLSPTPADIIRLNAFGLKIDEAKCRRVDQSMFLLPRLAVIDENVSFCQPTVGHEIWLDNCLRLVAPDDYQTILALNCFALSRPYTKLPDVSDPAGIQRIVSIFCDEMSPYPRDVLYAAVSYVRFGCDPTSGEKPPQQSETNTPSTPNPDECVAVGVLRGAVSVLWGMSLADMKSLTTHQLQAAVNHAYKFHNLNLGNTAETLAIGEFYDVLAEIKSRLTKSSED